MNKTKRNSILLAMAAFSGLVSVESVQGQTWTIEKTDIQASVASSTGVGRRHYNDRYDNLGQMISEWPTITEWQPNGFFMLTLEAEVEQGQEMTSAEKTSKVTGGQGKFLVHVKGPTGCAGQTQNVCFRVKSSATSQVKVTGPNTFEEFGESEEDVRTVPAPARGGSGQISVSVGESNSQSAVSLQAPPSDTVYGSNPIKMTLFQTSVTYGPDEKAIAEIPFTFSGEAKINSPISNDSTHSVFSKAEGLVNFLADDRFVSLSRPGAINEWLDSDGVTKHGDSRFSWDRRTPGESWPDPVYQTFVATLGGSWSLTQKINPITGNYYGPSFPNVTYTWSVGSNSNSGQSSDVDSNDPNRTQKTVSMPFGNPYLDAMAQPEEFVGPASPSGQTLVVTYNAKDNWDQATGTAKYVVHLHDEVEFVGDDVVSPAGREYAYLRKPNGTIQTVTGSDFRDESSDAIETSSSSGYAVQGGASLGLPIGKIIKWLKVIKNVHLDIGGSFEKHWDSSQNHVAPLGRDLTAMQKAYPISITRYEYRSRYYCHFLPEGEHKPTVPSGAGPYYGAMQGISPDAKYWELGTKEKTSEDSIVWLWVPENFPAPGPNDMPPRDIVESIYPV